MASWIDVCDAEGIDLEDVIRFDDEGCTFADCRSPSSGVFATDRLCTHEKVHLTDGPVTDKKIECTKRNGRFNCQAGAALRSLACDALTAYADGMREGRVEIELG